MMSWYAHSSLCSITWHSVVLTFTHSSKDSKGGKDTLKDSRSKLEEIDVKTIPNFAPGKTTHVVANKRNTAKSLQALIDGKYVVSKGFLDALDEATAPSDMNEPESLSLLEADFDGAWPKPQHYLPPPGKEPNERPAEIFDPDPERANIFDGYTFIFLDQDQFDTLQPPITQGDGKALIFPAIPGKTKPSEVIEFVKEAAHGITMGRAQTNSQRKGVVQVRFRPIKGHEDWSRRLQQQSSTITGQDLIEQNEFLDAILLKDASILVRPMPLPDASESTRDSNSVQPELVPAQTREARASTRGELSASQHDQRIFNARASTRETNRESAPNQVQVPSSPPAHPPEQPEQPSQVSVTEEPAMSRPVRRPIKFKGFVDDSDDDDSNPTGVGYSLNADIEASNIPDSVPHNQSNEPIDMDVEDSGSDTAVEDGTQRPQRSKKRPALSNDDDDLFPAQTRLKRQRMEEEQKAREAGKPLPSEKVRKKEKPKEAPKKVKRKEIDFEEELKKQRKKEAEAEEDQEPMHEALSKMTVEEMQGLAKVEKMDVSERSGPQTHRDGEESQRWDERWNGRKNFKKFKRKGQSDIPRRAQTVIVPLEEVQNTNVGAQDNFFAEKERLWEQRRKKNTRALEREESEASQSYADAQSHQEEVPTDLLMDGDEPEIIDVDRPRSTRRSTRGQSQAASTTASRKRPAPRSNATSDAKRQKKLNLIVEDEDEGSSEENAPKFKFRSRGK